MKKNVYVVKSQNKEGKEYYKLFIDFGYSELPISFNIAEISQYCDMRPSEVAALKLNDKKLVATFELKV